MSAHEIGSPPAFRRRIPLVRIDALVSAHLGPARLESKEQPAVFNRQIAMYLAKQVGGWSTTVIGRFYNGRDHSTVCYAIQRIKAFRKINPDVDQLLSKLETALQDPEPFGADSLSIRRPASIRLCRLSEDTLLDELADRIASRLIRFLDRVDNSGRRFANGKDAALRADGSPKIGN